MDATYSSAGTGAGGENGPLGRDSIIDRASSKCLLSTLAPEKPAPNASRTC